MVRVVSVWDELALATAHMYGDGRSLLSPLIDTLESERDVEVIIALLEACPDCAT